MRNKPKLGVIVPYRHRERQLPQFIKVMSTYLTQKGIPFEIIIVEQDDAKQFNRGSLLNVGFIRAKKLKCDYVVFHDIDILPIDVNYEYSKFPVHLATGFAGKTKEIFDEYFGGATLFPIKDFDLIDGYSNKYWDWGYEDTDLLFRCKTLGIDLDTLNIKNMGVPKKALMFNGIDSYVIGRNIFDLDYNTTFFAAFYPDDILCDHSKDADIYTVFSIPGYDTSISYNSFARYNFCTFDEDKNAIYVNSNIKTNYKTNICVTVDNDKKLIRVFQDGIFIGDTPIKKTFLSHSYDRFFYLGVGEPTRVGDERFFKGHITTFAAFSGILTDDDILNISNNEEQNFVEKFGDRVQLYYDTNHIERYKLVDLSGNGHDGKIINCKLTDLNFKEYKSLLIPYRRPSIFITLPHEENGFFENKWKNKATRWNQLRFHNEVYLNPELITNDGISTVRYVIYGTSEKDKVTKISVGI